MNEDVKDMIRWYVTGNGESYSRRRTDDAIRRILCKDKTVKDMEFCRKMLSMMNEKENKTEVPPNCTAFTVVEDCVDINLNRYLLFDREAKRAERIIKMHSVQQKLKDMGMKCSNTILLYGPAGTGKTTFGKYIAKKTGLPFVYVNMSYILDSALGKSQQNVCNLFHFVNTLECVFMLDEIDAIACRRGQSYDVAELSRVTIALLQEIDRINGSVILIGATNRLDIIDEAIISRFGNDKENLHEVMPPVDMDERIAFCRKYIDDLGFKISDDELCMLCSDSLNGENVTQRTLYKRIAHMVSMKLYEELEKEG